jgi:hypothetical protein
MTSSRVLLQRRSSVASKGKFTVAGGENDTSGVSHGVRISKNNISVSVRTEVYHGKYLSWQCCIYKQSVREGESEVNFYLKL